MKTIAKIIKHAAFTNTTSVKSLGEAITNSDQGSAESALFYVIRDGIGRRIDQLSLLSLMGPVLIQLRDPAYRLLLAETCNRALAFAEAQRAAMA